MNLELLNGWKVVNGQLVDPTGNTLGGVDDQITSDQYEECIGLPPPGRHLQILEDGVFVLASAVVAELVERKVGAPGC